MKIVDKDNKVIKKKDCFPCYSLKLNDFLQQEKGIMPIRVVLNKQTDKTCYLFILTDILDLALKEWTERKNTGNLYSPRIKRGVKK